mgnify:CR=1 FL=1
MNKTPRLKMGKQARRALDASERRTWQVSPVTRLMPNKKLYNRKKRRPEEDSSGGALAS